MFKLKSLFLAYLEIIGGVFFIVFAFFLLLMSGVIFFSKLIYINIETKKFRVRDFKIEKKCFFQKMTNQ